MALRRVEWTDNLSVGVESIDVQHRELVRRIDLFLRALSEKRARDEVATLVPYFGQYVQEHFATEEEMMASTGYPGIKEHVASHRSAEREYQQLATTFEREGITFGLQRGLLELVQWLEHHMETADRSLGGYLARLRSHRPFAPVFIQHRGISVLRLDYTKVLPGEFSEAFRKAAQVISSQPPCSIRVLTLFESRFDGTVAEAFKSYVSGNRPFIRASAVVATSFWNVIVTSARLHARPDLTLFSDESAALDWLVAR
jgi:hemerythrin